MQHQKSNHYQTSGILKYDGNPINIVLPPKPGYAESHHSRARMDVCSLTLSCLAQDPNLPASKLPFAWKLYEMLETVERNGFDTDIVSWVDNGEAFKVHDLERFVQEIVPTYFKQSKYKSFQRQLYFYGFQRVTAAAANGCTVGSYRHPMFVRGKKTLCLSMVPKKGKKRNSKFQESSKSEKENTNQPTPIMNQDHEGTMSFDGITPVPIMLPSTSESTVQASNTSKTPQNGSFDQSVDDPGFSRQQLQLQMLQREQFFKYIGAVTDEAQRKSKQPRRIEHDEEPCSIFGGKMFHTVSKRSRR